MGQELTQELGMLGPALKVLVDAGGEAVGREHAEAQRVESAPDRKEARAMGGILAEQLRDGFCFRARRNCA